MVQAGTQHRSSTSVGSATKIISPMTVRFDRAPSAGGSMDADEDIPDESFFFGVRCIQTGDQWGLLFAPCWSWGVSLCCRWRSCFIGYAVSRLAHGLFEFVVAFGVLYFIGAIAESW